MFLHIGCRSVNPFTSRSHIDLVKPQVESKLNRGQHKGNRFYNFVEKSFLWHDLVFDKFFQWIRWIQWQKC